MNKKFLSVVLFGALMAGSSVTFTGCIDNDEPAGITDLRGAKAELLRAKVAVEAANAARENAQAALILAKAEVQKAKAAFKNAKAAQEQAIADSMAAKTEAEKVRFEKLIAQYKQEMEEAALTHDSVMVKLQKDLAEANRDYELALKQIEIAKATLSDSQKVTLGALQGLVDTAQGDVTKAAESVAQAEDNLYDILLFKAQGWAVDSVNAEIEKHWIPELKKTVERDSIDVIAKETELAKLKEFAEKDPVTTDWRAEIKELEDSIAAMTIASNKYQVELDAFNNREEVVLALKAKNDAATAAELENIKIDAFEQDYKYHATGTPNYSWGRDKFTMAAGMADVKKPAVKNELDAAKALLAIYTLEKIAMLEELKADAEGAIADKKEAYETGVTDYKKLLKQYTDADGYNQTTDRNKVIKAIDDNYEDAIKTVSGDLETAARLAARNTIANAIVTYYKAVNAKVGLTTNDKKLTILEANKTQSILAWLEEYSGSVISAIKEDAWTAGADDLKKYFIPTATVIVDGTDAVKTQGSYDKLKTDLLAKSEDVFGTGCLSNEGEKYMRVEPTEAEVLAVFEADANADCGLAGTYYLAKAAKESEEYLYYEEWMADLKTAVTNLEAKYKAIEDLIEAKETASEEAEATYNELIAGTEAIQEAKDVVDAKKAAAGKVKNTLIKAVNEALGESFDDKFETSEQFAQVLKGAIATAESGLFEAQKALADAQNDLQKVLGGRYDAEAMARKQLDKEMTRLEAAQKAYETALKNLETGLKIMAGESSAE